MSKTRRASIDASTDATVATTPGFPTPRLRPHARGRTAPRNPAAQGRVAPLLPLPAGPFRPPHCPNRHCPYYEPSPQWRFVLWGFYQAPSCSKPLRRFRCLECDRTFTGRTFAVTYWLHHWDLLAYIATLSVAGSGVRQIARSLGVAHSTVARHLTRAARCCLLRHQELLAGAVLTEPVVVDGFETFEHSQYFPYHANLAAGKESWFLYHFTDSPLRRKGRMTAKQQARRTELEQALGRPDPQAVEKGIYELLRAIVRLVPRPLQPGATESLGAGSHQATAGSGELEWHSDDHPAYPRAAGRLAGESGVPRLRHQVTPSTDARTPANPLFAVNLADLLLRHCGANHRRETIAYDRRRQGGMERLAIFLVWRNAIKWRREKEPGETAAMRAGILSRGWSWRDVFRCRLFPRERQLPGVWWDYYWRRVRTAALGDRQTENRARYAF